MSNLSFDFAQQAFQPLAARMRPTTFAQYCGQSHLIGEGKPLRKALDAGHVHSMILWGPPGTGKTTLAEIIARQIHADVERISAVTSGIKEIREAIERAKENRLAARRTILFVDEVHRFNKSQQDAFLPHIEDGTIIFIGATTENPSFELNNALLSRAKVYILKSLSTQEITEVLKQALLDEERGLGKVRFVLEENVLEFLAEYVNGDARLALNSLELMADMAEETEAGKALTLSLLKNVLGERQARFDKQGDRFYDAISALHKSVRGSAPDAALYWYARILAAGGIRFMWHDVYSRLLLKMWVMRIRARCKWHLLLGIALLESVRRKGSVRLHKRLFIWRLYRKATQFIVHLIKRNNTLKKRQIMKYQHIYAMRLPI